MPFSPVLRVCTPWTSYLGNPLHGDYRPPGNGFATAVCSSIVLRYNRIGMNRTTRPADYRALAEFRRQIRKFLNLSDQAARATGLEPHQYHVLLAIRGLPEGTPAPIRALADQRLLRHHTAAELVDRMAKHGYVRRGRKPEDPRQC